MRLRLTGAERRRRVEAIEHAVAVEVEQSVLRPAAGREEEQLQLLGRQHPVPIQVERDLPVALGQVPSELEQPQHQNSNSPLLVGVREPGPLRCFARLDALIGKRGDAARSAAQSAGETAARTDALALPSAIDQQLGEQANGLLVLSLLAALAVAQEAQTDAPTQSSRGQRRSRSHYRRGRITAPNRTASIE